MSCDEFRWYDLGRLFRSPAKLGEPAKSEPIQAPFSRLESEPGAVADGQPERPVPATFVPTPITIPGASHALYGTPVAAPTRRVLSKDTLDGIFLETRHFMLTKGADINMNPTTTYEDIKKLYRAKAPITPEQFQQALDSLRAVVMDTAVTAATLSGEHWAQAKLMPFTTGEDAPGNGYYEARSAHEKSMRHLSKLVYWYAKAQAGLLYEPTSHEGSAPTPFNADEGLSDDEDEDAEEDDEDDEG